MQNESQRHRADRRRILAACLVYVVLLVASLALIAIFHVVQPALRALLGITPLFGLGLLVRAMMIAHRGSDEMHRRIDGEAAIVASLSVGLISFGYALAAQATGNFMQPNVLMLLIAPALVGVWGAAKYVIWWRYK